MVHVVVASVDSLYKVSDNFALEVPLLGGAEAKENMER